MATDDEVKDPRVEELPDVNEYLYQFYVLIV
jgi:hypothetical protein